jgi:uncharacterized protein (AIM24 family)
MPVHGSLFTDFREKDTQDPFSLQNKKLLRVDMRYGEVIARLGSMVAYQGDVRFAKKSTGVSKMFKSAMTGEGVSVMVCSGSGELFLADDASEIQIMYLENDAISVNGRNVLAFSNSIQWDIHRIQARGAAMTGGLYNVALRGTGYVAVTTKGEPIALDVASAPTFADAQAVVLWTSGVSMDVRIDTGGLGSMLRGGTGELLQMAFGGQGYVLVQPSESVTDGGHQGGGNQGPGGMLGQMLG